MELIINRGNKERIFIKEAKFNFKFLIVILFIIFLINTRSIFGNILFFVIISLFILLLYNPCQLCLLASINLINKEI